EHESRGLRRRAALRERDADPPRRAPQRRRRLDLSDRGRSAGLGEGPAPDRRRHALLPGLVPRSGELLHERRVQHDERGVGGLDSVGPRHRNAPARGGCPAAAFPPAPSPPAGGTPPPLPRASFSSVPSPAAPIWTQWNVTRASRLTRSRNASTQSGPSAVTP